jgi:hypothetical protein
MAAQIAKAWFALGEANEQIVLAEAAVVVREKTVQSFEERFAAALVEEGGNASQLRLAQTELAGSRATLALWQSERERALRQIELLAGRYPAGRMLSASGLPALPPPPPAGLPSELLLRRPDLLAAERRFAAAAKRSKAARLAKYPSFSLTGSRGTNSDSLHEVLNSSNGVWSLAGGVPTAEDGGVYCLGPFAARSASHETDDALHLHAWSDEAIYDAITVSALFNFYNRWVNASGVQTLPDEVHRERGRSLAQHGYLMQVGLSEGPEGE